MSARAPGQDSLVGPTGGTGRASRAWGRSAIAAGFLAFAWFFADRFGDLSGLAPYDFLFVLAATCLCASDGCWPVTQAARSLTAPPPEEARLGPAPFDLTRPRVPGRDSEGKRLAVTPSGPTLP